MTAAPSVPNKHASGTSRLGFSTALEFCAADSIPRNAQRVREMLDPMPCARVSPLGFQAAAKVSRLNQNHPMIEIRPTGMMTPQTVTAPIRPVIWGPPKFAAVVIQSRMIRPMHVVIGVEVNQGKKPARYPTAEIPIA